MNLNNLLIHPFIFAILPVVLIVAQIKTEVLPEELPPIIILLEVLTALILSTCFACLSADRRLEAGTAADKGKKAAAFTSLFVSLIFCYICIVSSIDAASTFLINQKPPIWLNLIFYATLSSACLAASLKSEWSFGNRKIQTDYSSLNKALNIVACMMLLMNVPPLLLFQMKVRSLAHELEAEMHSQVNSGKLRSSGQMPDIYYMVCDGFPNEHSLKNELATDPQFADFLRSKNFCVAERSFSNYDRTESSLCSSLNMQYLDGLMQKLNKERELLAYEEVLLIQDSIVLKTFRNLGYKIINIGPELGPTYWLPTGSTNYKHPGLNHFATALLLLTPAFAIEKYIPFLRDDLAEARLYPGSIIGEIAQIPGPKFVLLHTTLAHAPDIFNKSGQRLSLPPGLQTNWGSKLEYVSQLEFAQQNYEKWINSILEKSKTPPIIIVQSDHGPGLNLDTEQETKNIRMRILNAYYLPGKNCEGIYASVSPVNTFRILLNDYFNANLSLLPDRANWAPVYENNFELKEVSADLRY